MRRRTMKRNLILLVAAGAATSLLLLGLGPKKHGVLDLVSTVHAQEGYSLGTLSPNAQAKRGKECSNATLEGTYGFYGVGTVVPAGTSVARFTLDGQGNWFDSFTQNDNGTIIRGSHSGTYSVNPDCTGTLFGDAGQPIFDLVLVDGGKEFYSVRVDPANRVLSGVAKKQQEE
jgi:hypothetical protein